VKRLIIICEGETEQEFCRDVLYNHFFSKGIRIESPRIKKSNGGIVKWSELKKQIENHLKQDQTVFVSTLIDFYGIKASYLFPDFNNDAKEIATMELGMKTAIGNVLNARFIPYIQLHEFECFIFTSLNVLKKNFKSKEADFQAIEQIINKYPNPEDINNGPATAPSKRLEKYIPSYNKPVYGACLTADIGILEIRKKCPRFNNWIEQLEKI
jgi:hypothetical protein